MIIIYFFYGLAFLLMAATILMQPVKKEDLLNIKKDFWLVGLFGLTHGLNEWVDLFILRDEPFDVGLLKVIGGLLLPVSFLFLVIFASRIILRQTKRFGWLKFLWVISLSVWCGAYISTGDFLIAGISARYFICIPGAFLSALGLYLALAKSERRHLPLGVYIGTLVAIFALLIYGLLSGLVVPQADFLLAGFLNQQNFLRLFGLPVQFFRMLCAILLMLSVFGIREMFPKRREYIRLWIILMISIFVAEIAVMIVLNYLFAFLPVGVRDVFDALLLLILLSPLLLFTIKEMERRRELEEAIALEREHLEVTLQSIGDGVIATDTEGRIAIINRVAERLTGWSEAEAMGKPLEEVFHIVNEENHQRCPNPVKKILESGQAVGLGNHTMLISRDGTERFLGDSGAPIRDNAGNIKGVVLVFRDITEARQAEDRYRSILGTSQDGFWITDAEGRIQEVNDAYCRLVGYSRQELLKMNIRELEAQEAPYETTKHIQQVMKVGTDRFETRHRSKEGKIIDLEISATYLKFGRGQFVVFLHDITSRKIAQREQELFIEILRRLNQPEDWSMTIGGLLKLIKSYTEMEVVAIRLREGEDYPYFVQSGFSEEFVKVESSLCSRNESGDINRDSQGRPYLECMCGNIISGRTDPAKPFFTEGGSFWSNCTTELLASTSDEDRLSRTRNRCNSEGYESVALIPLRSGRETIGLLQFNDRRKGRFSLEFIQFFEGLGHSIGIACKRRQMEEELKDKMLTLERFNKFSVGREMKMVELKSQIAELKAQIEKAGGR